MSLERWKNKTREQPTFPNKRATVQDNAGKANYVPRAGKPVLRGLLADQDGLPQTSSLLKGQNADRGASGNA